MANGIPIYDDDMQKPPVGVKPGWLCAVQRISELASAIQRYANVEHGSSRRFPMQLWAEEIVLQLAIWDKLTERQEQIFGEDGE